MVKAVFDAAGFLRMGGALWTTVRTSQQWQNAAASCIKAAFAVQIASDSCRLPRTHADCRGLMQIATDSCGLRRTHVDCRGLN
jgi:hypothetical protein